MNKMTKNCLNTLILILASVLYGCGGSSSGGGSASDDDDTSGGSTFSGSTDPASVDADNAQVIGEAAGESVGQAASAEESRSALPFGVEVTVNIEYPEALHQVIYDVSQLALLPSGIDLSTQVCFGGGSADINSLPSVSGPASITMTFDNCSVDSTMTMSGTVVMDFEDISDPNAGFSIEYTNFTVSGLGFGTQSINYSISCTSATACTSYSDFDGSDGGSHRISDFSISGNASSGYNGSADFSHESYGSVSIDLSNVTYGNCGSAPDGGSITFNSSNGTSGSITFDSDCTASGSWSNGTSSGSF